MKKAFFISVSLIMFIASISLMTGCDTCDEIEDLATIFSEGVVGFHYFPGQMTYYFDLETGTCSYDPGPNADFMLDLNPEDMESIYPQNGSSLLNLENVSFDYISYSDLVSYTYPSGGFPLNYEEWTTTYEGTNIIATITNTGRYCKFIFYRNGMDATIYWVTFNIQ